MFAKRQSDATGESDSDREFKDGAMVKRKSRGSYEDPANTKLEMPLSVKAVINKIEQAQLLRAKEAILSRLIEIMSKVELIMTRYAIDSTSPGKRGSISESQRKKRKVFLEKIAGHVKSIDIREKLLTKLLSWLEEWNFVLSEVAEIDVDEYLHWIAQMELLPEMLKEMDGSINTLCQITTLLLEEKKRQKKKLVTRGTLWKAWKERVVKRPAAAHALRPDQMICDQLALSTKVSEIQDMLQELISSAMLSKLENNAIKYISATILNLSKALSMVSDELKLMTLQATSVGVNEERETEKDFLKRVIQDLSKENEMLHQKLRDSEEKCDQLIRIKNFLGRQLLVPTTPSLRMLVLGSPQASVSKEVDSGEIDSLLNKELEKIIDESQTKGVRATAIKWDSSMTYVAQGEMAVDVAKQQAEDKADQDQKKQHPPVPLPAETSDANLEKEEKKVMEIASSQFSDLQALDMKRKDGKSFLEGKPQGQEVKSGASSLWERFKKGRSEHSLGKSPASSEVKMVPPVKPMDKESKTEAEQTKASQPESTPEPPKIETKGKKPLPGKTEEMPGTTKQQQSKLQSKTPKQTPATPDARSEQNTLESFQKAILAFLREKTNNVGKAFDPKSIQEEEKSLERAEVEKLYLIKAKTEEYVQKVAETVTRTLRAYKESRKKQLREKLSKPQKATPALPQPFAGQGFISAKSDLVSFLLSEMTDPVVRALTQTILDELDSEKDGVTVSAAAQDHKDKRQEWQRWEEEAWKEEQRLPKQAEPKHRAREKAAEQEEWRPAAAAAMTPDMSRAQDLREREDVDKEKPKGVRDAEEGPRPKGSKSKLPPKGDSKSKDLFKTFTQSAMVLTPRWMKSLKLQTSQVQLFQVDPRAMESPEDKQPFSPRTLLVSAKPLPVPAPEQAQIVDSKISQISRASFIPEREQVWGGPPSHEPMKEVQIPPPTAKQEQELGTQLMAPRILQQTLTPAGAYISEIQTAEQVPTSGVTVTQRAVLPLQQIQGKDITLTLKQALDQGIAPTPEPAKEPRITLTPQQAQALGIVLTPEQAKAQTISLTPQQAQALALTLTPEQTKEQEISLTPPQAQRLGITLTSEQAQALGLTLTPEQTKAQRVSLSPQQAQVLGVSLTPQQAQAQRINLTPEQAQALGIDTTPQLALAQTSIFTSQLAQAQQITITPEEAEDLGITLTPQQVKVQGISLTPQQGQALGMALTSDQAKAQGIILTPQQAQALGLTLTPQQIKTQRVRLTPERAQALGIAITSEQAQALGITLIPKLAQPQEISLSPEEAQALGLTLTPQQARIQKIFLTPKQAQALGINLTPEQAKTVKISLTPQQAQVLGITLTLEQTKAQRISLTTEQAQVLGITLSLQQAQALGVAPTLKQTAASGITLIPEPGKEKEVSLTRVQALALEISPPPEQTHNLGISLSAQQARELGLTLTSRQAKVQRICLTPEQARALGVSFTPEQAKGWRISLTPEQAQALGLTLTTEQAKAHRISLTPGQAEALGITLTPGQAQALGIRFTSSRFQTRGISPLKKFQELEAPLTYEQAAALRGGPTTERIQTLKVPVTPESIQTPKPAVASKQTQTIEIPLTPQLSPAFGIPLPQGQGKASGITLRPGQTQAFQQAQALQPPLTSRQAPLPGQFGPGEIQTLTFTIALEKAQNLGVTFTQEQTQAASITLTSEQVAALEDALTEELAWTWGLLTAPPAALVPSPDRQLPTSIALQKLKSSQAPSSPRTSLATSFLPDSEKLEETRVSPTYRQILADRGQVTPTQLLTPEVPSTPGLPLGHWHPFKPGDTGSPLMPETRLTHRRPTPPLGSGAPPTSGEIPGLFVPGGSAVPFQPPAIHGQTPYMQTYSTPGQPKPSLIIAEQGFAVRTPVSAEAFPVPGRPQRISPSSVSQKRPVAVSPPKPESIRAHPSAALGFEVSPAPFPMEKMQMSKFSDIFEEARVLQDSPDMRSLGMFQPYVTSSRIPRSKSHHIGEKAPSAREKSIASLPSLTTQLSQTPQITPSDRGQRPRLPPIDEPWILSPVPGTRKTKMVGSPVTAQQHEDRYFVDVEAQRKNLAILNHAAQTAGLPSQYHTIARNLIIELLHMNTVRLGYLSRKYLAYRLIQLARNNIIKRLRAIQNTGKGYETQNLFTMLDRIDHYQKKVMWFWTEKQNQLEQRRKHCLWSMMQFFTQLERGFKLNLSQPVPLLSDLKQIPDLPKFQRPVLELLIEDKKPNIFKTLGEQAQLEAIWNADLSTSSYPITEKTSLNTLWAQLGGYPDIPRLLELDIQSTFRKSLASIRSKAKKIPK
nr:protein FAM186A isoform X1 [Peromyscus maniculatus bairdii]